MLRFLGFLLGALVAASGPAMAQHTVRYTVAPHPETATVTVEALVEGLSMGDVPQLAIHEGYASVDDFYRDIEGLAVEDYRIGPLTDGATPSPHLWQLDRPLSGTSLTYSYTVRVLQEIPDAVARFKPSMSQSRYYSNGYPLFIFPQLPGSDPETTIDRIDVDFVPPAGWNVITSFDRSDGSAGADSLEAVLYSSVAMGDYRRHSSPLPNGATLTLAIPGTWAFSDADLQEVLLKLVGAQWDVMRSWHSPTYTVTLSQHRTPGSKSGSGLTNAFEMFASHEVALEDFYFLVSHENFHYWNGHRIRYEEARNRWFSEGFTNYYSLLFLARQDLWGLDRVLAEFTRSYQDYFQSPLSTMITFQDAGRYFWDWDEYADHFYTKGMLIGLMVDVRLRAESENRLSLDGFMRHLDAKLYGTDLFLNDQRFQAEIEAYSGTDWQAFVDATIAGTAWLDVNSVIRSGGMELASESCDLADPGVVLMPKFCEDERPCGYDATSVDSQGPAYAAGLREGDQVKEHRMSRRPGGSVRLVVMSDGAEQTLSYQSATAHKQCPTLRFLEQVTPLQESIRRDIW